MSHLSRRQFLCNLGIGAAAGLAGGGLLSAMSCSRGAKSPIAPASPKPNIVFILVDDMGWADLACYGNRFHETPNIDRLASQGLRFTQAYAACPVCSPTRASVLSGQYPARLGITDFIPGHQRPYERLRVPRNRTQYLPLEIVTLAEALAPAGYTSGMFGKWHLGEAPEYLPDRQGFNESLVHLGVHYGFQTIPPGQYPPDANIADVITDRAEQFLEANRDRPFFLYLAHFAVHVPLQAAPDIVEKYKRKPVPEGCIGNPVYAAMVEHVDRSVGRVLARIDALGLAKNTIVVLFSDNGGAYEIFKGVGEPITSNAPLRGEKGTLYEGGIREPLIVRWPGAVAAGGTCDTPVVSVDFYPTFLQLTGAAGAQIAGAGEAQIAGTGGAQIAGAGATAPGSGSQPLDGESLAALWTRGGKAARALRDRPIFWHYPHYHHSTPAGAVRRGDWKLIEFFDDGHLELYNLRDDIGEARNLAEQEPARARELQALLADWRRRVNAAMPEPNPDYDPALAPKFSWELPKPA